MDILTSNSLLMMEKSLDFLWEKQRAISDNLTNVETPGYKAKYVTFEEALRSSLQNAGRGEGTRAALRQVLEDARPRVHVASDETTRMDGNGVNATEQGVELSRNALQMQYVINAINSDLGTLRIAIRG